MEWNLIVNLLMGLGTFLMALFTLVIIFQNRKYKQDTNRAKIVPYFETARNLDIFFVVKNFGLSEARNVKVSTNETFINTDGEVLKSFFDNEIKSMPSDFIIKLLFDHGGTYYNNFKDNFPIYNVTVDYEDIYGKHQSETYKMNLGYIAETSFIGIDSDDVNYYLRDIGRNIKDNSLKRPTDELFGIPSIGASLHEIDNSLKTLLDNSDNDEN
jgi:hypothetical protein